MGFKNCTSREKSLWWTWLFLKSTTIRLSGFLWQRRFIINVAS
jgi:hypothetical protein